MKQGGAKPPPPPPPDDDLDEEDKPGIGLVVLSWIYDHAAIVAGALAVPACGLVAYRNKNIFYRRGQGGSEHGI